MHDLRAGRPPLVDGLTASERLGPLFRELDTRQADARRLQREIEALERDKRTAYGSDRRAAAVALRAGLPDPGDRTLAAIDERLRDTKRSAGVNRQAIADLQADVEVLVGREGPMLAPEAAGYARSLEAEAAAMLQTYAELVGRIAQTRALERWLRTGGDSRASVVFPPVPGLPNGSASGQLYAMPAVIGALLAVHDASLADTPVDAEPEATETVQRPQRTRGRATVAA